MICVDSNYLIRGLVPGTPEARKLVEWHLAGETLVTSAIAWYEFLCGPVTAAHVRAMDAFLTGGHIPFEGAQAAEAARLFNAAGRPRRLRVDAMIPASPIVARSRSSESSRSSAAASASSDPEGKTRPVTPSSITSRHPGRSLATTGTPHARLSRTTIGSPSEEVDSTVVADIA